MTEHENHRKTSRSTVAIAVAGHTTVAYFDDQSSAHGYSTWLTRLGYSPVSVYL